MWAWRRNVRTHRNQLVAHFAHTSESSHRPRLDDDQRFPRRIPRRTQKRRISDLAVRVGKQHHVMSYERGSLPQIRLLPFRRASRHRSALVHQSAILLHQRHRFECFRRPQRRPRARTQIEQALRIQRRGQFRHHHPDRRICRGHPHRHIRRPLGVCPQFCPAALAVSRRKLSPRSGYPREPHRVHSSLNSCA